MGTFKEATKHMTDPKYMATHVSRTPLFVLQGPQYIKEFLQKQNLYHKDFQAIRLLAGNGLVGAEGETWKRHRKIISSSFNFEFLKTNIPTILNTTKEFFDKLSNDDLKNYSAISRIQDITGEIVGRIFFGEHLNSYTFEGKSLTLVLASIISELGLLSNDAMIVMFGDRILKLPFVPKYRRIMQRVNGFRKVCFDIIKDRKAKSDSANNDLLSSLLATQQSEDVEKRLSDEDIVDEFITFFIAGMDTTGHLIGMTFYNLTQHPEYIQKLQEERERTYNHDQELTTDTLAKMEVLHSFLKETLRFYTPAPMTFGRIADADHDLLDLKIKKGDVVFPLFLTPAFDEKHFDKPNEFNPARWANPESKMDPYAFTPFSAGPRNCIGQHLAMMESKVIVSEFLERFSFTLKDGYKLKMTLRFLYEPEDELLLTLTPKTN